MNKFQVLCLLYAIWWQGIRLHDLSEDQITALERMYEANDLDAKNLKDYVYNKLRQKAENEAYRAYQFLVQN